MESKTKVKRGKEQARRLKVHSLLVRDVRACPALLGAAERGPVGQTASFLEEITEKQEEMLAAEYEEMKFKERVKTRGDTSSLPFHLCKHSQVRNTCLSELQNELVLAGHRVAQFHRHTT